jgi:hypothetical protein
MEAGATGANDGSVNSSANAALGRAFHEQRGHKTVSVRCDMCNKEVAEVRLIVWRGRVWRVYGATVEVADTERVIRRRASTGWRPTALQAWALNNKGIDTPSQATPTPPGQRVPPDRTLHVEILESRTQPKLMQAHCAAHGNVFVLDRSLLEGTQTRVLVRRARPLRP